MSLGNLVHEGKKHPAKTDLTPSRVRHLGTKLLSVAMAVILAVGMMPLPRAEAQNFAPENIAPANVIQDYAVFDDTNTLTFKYGDPSEEAGTIYTDFADLSGIDSIHDLPWGDDQDLIDAVETVVFDETAYTYELQTMSYYFAGMQNLQTVQGIGYLDTDALVDMKSTFADCSSLTEVDFGGFTTSNFLHTTENMFAGCSSLESLDLSGFRTRDATNMSGMFTNCDALKSVTLGKDFGFNGSTQLPEPNDSDYTDTWGLKGNFDIEPLTASDLADRYDGNTMAGTWTWAILPATYAAFDSSNTTLSFKYASYTLENDTTTVYEVDENADYGGDSLLPWVECKDQVTSVVFDSSIRDILIPRSTAYWFSDCSQLTSLTGLQYLTTQQNTDMTGMFQNCSLIQTLDLSSMTTPGVQYTTDMFNGCTKLTTLDISSFALTDLLASGDMFEGCNALSTISLGAAFSFGEATLPEPSGAHATGKWIKDNNPEPAYTSAELQQLTGQDLAGTWTWEIFIDSNYATIDLSDPDNVVFTFMYGEDRPEETDTLKVVDDFNVDTYTASADRPVAWFENRTKIKTVIFDDSVVGHLQPVSTAFWFCDFQSLESIVGLDKLDTSKVTSMAYMFADCSSLVGIDLSAFDTGSVTSMLGMFMLSENLASLDLSSFDTTNVETMWRLFDGCTGLSSLNLSSFVTTEETSMGLMFDNCSALVSVVLGPSFMFKNEVGAILPGEDGFWVKNGSDPVMSFTPEELAEYSRGEDPDMAGTWLWVENDPINYAIFDGSNKLTFKYGVTDVDPDTTKAGAVVYTGYDTETYSMQDPCPWDDVVSSIQTVVFDESLISIDEDEYISYHLAPVSTACWFDRFSSLTSIENLRLLDTSNVTSMAYMFEYCSNLQTLDLSHFDTTNVRQINGMFNGDLALTSLDLSSFILTGVTDISDMFKDCTHLTSIELFTSEDGSISNLNSTFADCIALTSLEFYGINTTGFYDMTSLFEGCQSLTTLDLSSFRPINAARMVGMFSGCTELQSLDISSLSTASISENGMQAMFRNCSSLSRLKLGESFAFRNIPSEQVVGFLPTPTGSGYTGTWMLEASDPVLEYTAEDLVTNYDGATMAGSWIWREIPYVTYALLSVDSSTLTFKHGNKGLEKVGTYAAIYDIDDNASYRRPSDIPWAAAKNSVTSVVFDDSLSSVLVPFSTAYWFSGFSKLQTVTDISVLNVSQVSSMLRMFENCSALTSIDLSDMNLLVLEDSGSMFAGCTSLASINLSGFDTSYVKYMENMFKDCSSLTSLDVSSFTTGSVEDMHSMFENCESLEAIDGLSQFDTTQTTSMASMFYGCSSLEALDLSSFSTSQASMSAIFSGCTSLNRVDLGRKFVFNSGALLPNPPDMIDLSARYTGKWMLEGSNPVIAYDPSELAQNYSGTTMSGSWVWQSETVEPYALYKASEKTLIFKYGYPSDEIEGSGIVYIPDAADPTPWSEARLGTETVSFDASCDEVFKPTSMAAWFSGFVNLKTVRGLDYLDTSAVADMSSLFENCTKLETLDLSSLATGEVYAMDAMFSGCTSLTSLDLSSFEILDDTSMDGMFANCAVLKSVDLGEEWFFNDGSLLPTPKGAAYTECWVLEGSDEFGPYTPAELMENYNGATMAGTWEWQSSGAIEVEEEAVGYADRPSSDRHESATQGIYAHACNIYVSSTEPTAAALKEAAGAYSYEIGTLSYLNTFVLVICDEEAWWTKPGTNLIVRFMSPDGTKWDIPCMVEYKESDITEEDLPEANSLVYTAAEQTLFTNKALPEGYESISYSADNGLTWSNDIPKGLNADSYSYKVRFNPKEGYEEVIWNAPITATIAQAPLTIAASSQTIMIKTLPSTPTVTYTGFVGEETASVLTGTLSFAFVDAQGQPYTTASPAGTYSIVPSGLSAANYAITYENGVLTVSSQTPAEKAMNDDVNKALKSFTDADPAGSTFAALQFKAAKVTKNSIKFTWKKVKNVTNYVVIGNLCGKKYKYAVAAKLKSTAKTLTVKKLKAGKAYKYTVLGYDKNGKRIVTAKPLHVYTKGSKFANAKKIKLSKKKVTLKAKKSLKLKAKVTKGGKVYKPHRKVLFESSNSKVATVAAKTGKIKAKKKGSCVIYAYTCDGKMATCKVKVK